MAKKSTKGKGKSGGRHQRPSRQEQDVVRHMDRAKKKSPRPRQSALPGMEDARIEAIEELGRKYADLRDRRRDLAAEKKNLDVATIRAMQAHGKVKYSRRGVIILVKGKTEVSVQVRPLRQPAVEASEEPREPFDTAPDGAVDEQGVH